MSTQTTHLKLDLREASDIFNPLSTNANFESLDNIIYEIQKKGGVPTFTTTASANLLKLSENPTPNSTVFKFVAAGDANTWSFSKTINNIVALDGSKKTVKGGNMYVAWVNSANAMVVIAWPDVVNAQTFDGKGPAEWATAAQLQTVNTTAANATQTAQAAATVANNALKVANAAGMKMVKVWERTAETGAFTANLSNLPANTKALLIIFSASRENLLTCTTAVVPFNQDASNCYLQMWNVSGSNTFKMCARKISDISANSISFSAGRACSGYNYNIEGSEVCVPTIIYALA